MRSVRGLCSDIRDTASLDRVASVKDNLGQCGRSFMTCLRLEASLTPPS
jgi:hypothetical protein